MQPPSRAMTMRRSSAWMSCFTVEVSEVPTTRSGVRRLSGALRSIPSTQGVKESFLSPSFRRGDETLLKLYHKEKEPHLRGPSHGTVPKRAWFAGLRVLRLLRSLWIGRARLRGVQSSDAVAKPPRFAIFASRHGEISEVRTPLQVLVPKQIGRHPTHNASVGENVSHLAHCALRT